MTDKKRFKQAVFIFKICYLVYLLLAFNAFVNGMAWMNAASYVLTAAGLFMLIWMLFQYKRYKNAYNLWILGVFVISYVISAGLHISYGGVENIKGLIWLLLPIFLIYVTAFDMSGAEIRRELKWISSIYIGYSTIANVISLSMVYWGRMLDYKDLAGTIHSIGYRWNRLWGIYDDPNHGATITMIAVFLLIYLFLQAKGIWKRVVYVLCFLVNYAYIVLSNSRTGALALAAGIVFAGVAVFWMNARNKHRTNRKYTVFIVLCAFITAGAVLAGTFTLDAAYQKLDKKIVTILNTKNKTAKNKKIIQDQVRKKDLEKDYSNGRLEIWKSGFELVKRSPVAGVGFRNIPGYAKEYFPKGYLVKNPGGIQYDSMHNLELDVLVGQGIIGGIIFLLFLGNTCVVLWKRIHLVSSDNESEVVCSAVIAGTLLLAGTFLSFIFYVNAPQNLCFWLFLGYALRYCQIGEEKKV